VRSAETNVTTAANEGVDQAQYTRRYRSALRDVPRASCLRLASSLDACGGESYGGDDGENHCKADREALTRGDAQQGSQPPIREPDDEPEGAIDQRLADHQVDIEHAMPDDADGKGHLQEREA